MKLIHNFMTKVLALGQSKHVPTSTATSLWELTAKDAKGNTFDFSTLKGKIVIVTNVASFCGFTAGHYAGFKDLSDKFGDKVAIVAFPCGQFLKQEYSDINKTCSLAERKQFKGVMMENVLVNGPEASPVFNFVKVSSGDLSNVEWNFEAFLVRPDTGKVVKRFRSTDKPSSYVPFIEEILKEVETDGGNTSANAAA